MSDEAEVIRYLDPGEWRIIQRRIAVRDGAMKEHESAEAALQDAVALLAPDQDATLTLKDGRPVLVRQPEVEVEDGP